ncbi:MAG: tetratricopeptide repeat protein [Pseudomonadota bacterium]
MRKLTFTALFRRLSAALAVMVLGIPAVAETPAGEAATDVTTQYRNGDAAFRLGHMTAAFTLFEIRCAEGSAYDCYRQGDMYRRALGTEQDYDLAAAAYDRACELGYGEACRAIANMYFEGRGLALDYPAARTLYASGCDLNDAASCAVLGNMMYAGMGGPRERIEGADHMRRACLQDVAYACEQVRRYGLSNQGERSNTLRRGWWSGN